MVDNGLNNSALLAKKFVRTKGVIINHKSKDRRYNGVNDCCTFNANSAIFQLYRGENKIIFNEIMMMSALYWANTLGLIL